jgi:hypothetical protein
VGDYKLYSRSPTYLKPKGTFFSIAEGPLYYITQAVYNRWPLIFGGIPRAYRSILCYPDASLAQDVVEWYEKQWISIIPIDSKFDMDEALKVRKNYSLLPQLLTVSKGV